MTKIKQGIIAGLAFGFLDVLIMIPIEMADKKIAMAGAFCNRFAIGFLIPNVQLSIPSWLKGLLIGLLISLPDAIITGAFAPVLATGVLGGAVIGWLVNKNKLPKT